MGHNDMITSLAQDAHQAQAIGPAGDSGNDGSILDQLALIAKDEINVFKHTDYLQPVKQ
jgi:hypothetical protein